MVKKRVGELLAGGHKQLLLNLAAVPYMDSTCVGELVSPSSRCATAAER